MRRTLTAIALAGLLAVIVPTPARVAAAQLATVPGAEAWRTTEPDRQLGAGSQVAVNPRGDAVYVLNIRTVLVDRQASGHDFSLLAYDPISGEHLWEATYDGPGEGAYNLDWAEALAVSPDGETVYMGGSSSAGRRCDSCGDPNFDYATVAVDADTGDVLWTTRWDNGEEQDQFDRSDALIDVAVSPDSDVVYVTGVGGGALDPETRRAPVDIVTIAYDASTGGELWRLRYDGPRGMHDYPVAMDVSPDGQRVVITGGTPADNYSSHLPDEQTLTLGLDAATGKVVWERFYNVELMSNASDIGVSPDGDVTYVSTSSYGGTTSTDFVALAYDTATGETIWESRYAYAGIHIAEEVKSLAVSPTGDAIYLTGGAGAEQKFTTGRDYQTVAFDAATGDVLWAERFNGSGSVSEDAEDVVVSPDGLWVYVTGGTQNALNRISYTTLAYAAGTGTLVWEGEHFTVTGTPSGGDGAKAVAVHPDGGRVYVTGQDGAFLTTLAYCALPVSTAGHCAPGLGELP